MGERKVLNKYYPPDFDPSKLQRIQRPMNNQIFVRTMLSMTIRCKLCGNFMYKGTKVNARKEDAVGKKYLDFQIYRFYFKCTKCLGEITMKTDLKNADYEIESGATRNYEPWRDEEKRLENEKRERELAEMGDAMKTLENRTMESKRTIDSLGALEELKSLKSRQETVAGDAMLAALKCSAVEKEKQFEEEVEAQIKSINFQNSRHYGRRIREEENDDDDDDGVLTHDNLKRQKDSEKHPGKPTDLLTNASFPCSSSHGGKRSDSRDFENLKFIIKSSTADDINGSGGGGSSSVLESLRLNYEDDLTC